jgi:hypothetical protein
MAISLICQWEYGYLGDNKTLDYNRGHMGGAYMIWDESDHGSIWMKMWGIWSVYVMSLVAG